MEKEIEKLEAKKVTLHERMAVVVNDFEELNQLNKELKEIEVLIDDKTMEWLDLAERA